MNAKTEAHSDCLAAGSGLEEAEKARDDSDFSRAAREVGRVRAFFENNPLLWDELRAVCESHLASGRPFGIQEQIERWRWFRPTTSDGSELKLNNSWSPIIARLLIAEYPEAAELVERRRSRYDMLFEEVPSRGA